MDDFEVLTLDIRTYVRIMKADKTACLLPTSERTKCNGKTPNLVEHWQPNESSVNHNAGVRPFGNITGTGYLRKPK